MSEPLKRGWSGRVVLHLMDEAPRLGNGRRYVYARVGNRHVHLQHERGGSIVKMPRDLFDSIFAASGSVILETLVAVNGES